MKKILKIVGWGALIIVLLFALILAVASPVAKYVVNNYGEQIVGRQLHTESVLINPYWGGVTIKDFECKEVNGETNFISFDKLYVQIAYPQLIAQRVKLRKIQLDGFNGQSTRELGRCRKSLHKEQDNLKKLSAYGYGIIQPVAGRLACGDIGNGKMPEPEVLLQHILTTRRRMPAWSLVCRQAEG